MKVRIFMCIVLSKRFYCQFKCIKNLLLIQIKLRNCRTLDLGANKPIGVFQLLGGVC